MTTNQQRAILDVYPTEEEKDQDPVTYPYMVDDPTSAADLIARIQRDAYIASLN